MKNFYKKIVKKAFNAIGLDIVKINKNPHNSFLGLKKLPIKTIIDVVANEGQFAKMASSVFPDAQIYCFEPIPAAFQKLDLWAKTMNNKVKCFNLALGDSEEEIEMFHHTGHSPSSSILKTTQTCESLYPFTKSQQPIKVKKTTLDNVVQKYAITLIPEILIKLDVQGYEDRVIRGGTETFSKARASILEVCLDELYENQATFQDISLLLNDLGFHYGGNLAQTYANDGHVIFIDAVFVK
jgi:FkbM family methyltransferase